MVPKKLTKTISRVVRILARWRKKYVLIVIILLANLFPQNLSLLEKTTMAIVKNPGDGLAHLSLAKIFLANNNIEEAKREIILSETDNKKKAEIAREIGALKETIGASQKVERKILGWQKVAREKPDFRDAYLELSLLNYQLGRTEMARYFLGKALFLDPNFFPTKEFQKIISEEK